MKLARLYMCIGNKRKDALHKLTTYLVRHFHTIGIEDLNIKGMMKNHHLARSIADMSFYELRRQLEYKTGWHGRKIVVADRFFASSKLCSICGCKKEELPLSVRQWRCETCHVWHDRDINAAINLKNYAVSSTVKACGEESADLDRMMKVKLASMKQESNAKATYE